MKKEINLKKKICVEELLAEWGFEIINIQNDKIRIKVIDKENGQIWILNLNLHGW